VHGHYLHHDTVDLWIRRPKPARRALPELSLSTPAGRTSCLYSHARIPRDSPRHAPTGTRGTGIRSRPSGVPVEPPQGAAWSVDEGGGGAGATCGAPAPRSSGPRPSPTRRYVHRRSWNLWHRRCGRTSAASNCIASASALCSITNAAARTVGQIRRGSTPASTAICIV
jgi:hypothetical protein